ncbi:hypothetical protein C7S17_3395 [Burkholderia thailandensis]|nr:hypothetical protein [Burkholderia thailandensis]
MRGRCGGASCDAVIVRQRRHCRANDAPFSEKQRQDTTKKNDRSI